MTEAKTVGGQLSSLMTQAGQCVRAIKRDAYELSQETDAQLALLVALVHKAQKVMEKSKEPAPPVMLDLDGDPAQLVLGRVDITPYKEEKNGEEKDSVPEESKTLSE